MKERLYGVIGVGGGGNNAVNRMIEAGVQGVHFVVANTDAQVLKAVNCEDKIILGPDVSKGLGAGANPDIGREAAIESSEQVRNILTGTDMLFIAAGMGGGTGTGAAPIIAEIAQDMGILTIGIITTPFSFEGPSRSKYAETGVVELRKYVDAIIVVSNDKLLQIIGAAPLKDSFREADNILRQGVQTITDLIAVPSLINLDFADVRNIMRNTGKALFGIGIGSGKDKAMEAANKAIISPLLDASIHGATNAIVNVTGGNTLTLNDANDAVDIIHQAIGSDINIIFGVAINDRLDDEMIVTVIATGFDKEKAAEMQEQEVSRTSRKNYDQDDYSEILRQAAQSDEFVPKSRNHDGEEVVNEDDEDLPDFLK